MISDPEKLRKVYEERECVICKKKYYVTKSRRHSRRPIGIRPRNSRTCSTKCSKEYRKQKWKTI